MYVLSRPKAKDCLGKVPPGWVLVWARIRWVERGGGYQVKEVADLVSEQHGNSPSAFTQLPNGAASRLGTERQKHESGLGRYLTPVAEDLRLTETIQSHHRFAQEGHLSHQNRRRLRTFRQLLLQSLVRLQRQRNKRAIMLTYRRRKKLT